MLTRCDDCDRVRVAIGELLGAGGWETRNQPRVALIGLRGAGKSTLGQRLADDLGSLCGVEP